MAPFTLSGFAESFLVLMNTPLVPPDSAQYPREVPLTDMPRRSPERESRRRSSGSDISSSSQNSSSSHSHDVHPNFSANHHVARLPPVPRGSPRPSGSPPRSPSPPVPATKRLPRLPPEAPPQPPSRVRFADGAIDIDG